MTFETKLIVKVLLRAMKQAISGLEKILREDTHKVKNL